MQKIDPSFSYVPDPVECLGDHTVTAFLCFDVGSAGGDNVHDNWLNFMRSPTPDFKEGADFKNGYREMKLRGLSDACPVEIEKFLAPPSACPGLTNRSSAQQIDISEANKYLYFLDNFS